MLSTRLRQHSTSFFCTRRGCIFDRDNERLDCMFATLVLELLSEYGGAEFSVWSPLTSNEKKTYAFNDGNGLTERKTCSSSMPCLHFAAFYADCYHQELP